MLVVLGLLPGLTSRLRHYIIALTLFPSTAFPRLFAIHQTFLWMALEWDLISGTVDEVCVVIELRTRTVL